jgi:hypothetical protein
MGLAFGRVTLWTKGGSSHARVTEEEFCPQTGGQQKLRMATDRLCCFLSRDPLVSALPAHHFPDPKTILKKICVICEICG